MWEAGQQSRLTVFGKERVLQRPHMQLQSGIYLHSVCKRRNTPKNIRFYAGVGSGRIRYNVEVYMVYGDAAWHCQYLYEWGDYSGLAT